MRYRPCPIGLALGGGVFIEDGGDEVITDALFSKGSADARATPPSDSLGSREAVGIPLVGDGADLLKTVQHA